MSAIDWLGEVEHSWSKVPLFIIGNPEKTPNKGLIEKNLLSLSYGRIVRRDFESTEGLVPASYETYQIVEPGDVVLRFTDLQNDQRSLRSGLVGERGIITSAYLSLTPDRNRIHPGYLAYMMRALDLNKVFYRMGSGVRQSLNWREFSLMRIPLPPLETQQRIAEYLDRETAEIDAAVADLDKYVELLEKRKRAVGSALLEAVKSEPTTLKVHLGSLGLFVSGSGFPHKYQGIEGEEFPFYKVGSISTADKDAVIQDARNSISQEVAGELGAKIIPAGSVLMAKIGEAMRLCRFVVNASDCCIDNNMMAIIPRQGIIIADYLRLALSLVTVDILINPGPVPSLNVQGLRMFSIPLPAVDVQEDVTTKWKTETAEIDSLIADSTKLRELLLKRRSVLISDVVTGRKQV